MRSSSRVIRRAAGDEMQAWEPLDLNGPSGSEQEVQVEEILALFCGPRRVQTAGGVLYPASLEPQVSVWTPDELVQTLPFEVMDWEPETEEAGHPDLEERSPLSLTSEADAQNEILEMLGQARARAEEIILQAERLADERMAQAQAEIQQAVEEGYRRGQEQAMAEARSAIESARATVEEVNEWRVRMLAQSEPLVVELVRQIARSMFGNGLELDSHLLQANLERAMENARSLGDLTLYLNPADSEKLEAAWRENQELRTGNRIQIIPSAGIKPGGCYIQGAMGSVDARIETQLDAVLKVFDEQDEPVEEGH
ncbi:MAG TPA: hypothetical protein DEQ80_09090 [Anaerolinea thermolimosa]|uniref:Flagellar assembly protein FliH/Type III secretion system HrpE domain-containing protein n=1 Tax=Anaerolinea thermolimosa TaxID=229919 RepID=A0A3D1JHE8_9CHLR|nr:hypothetical protein [Anaerolinea thermolimosa]